MRGVQKINSKTVTSSMLGNFRCLSSFLNIFLLLIWIFHFGGIASTFILHLWAFSKVEQHLVESFVKHKTMNAYIGKVICMTCKCIGWSNQLHVQSSHTFSETIQRHDKSSSRWSRSTEGNMKLDLRKDDNMTFGLESETFV